MQERALPLTTKRSPGWRGRAAFLRDDLDLIAVAQHCAQRHHAAVHFGSDRHIADAAMHGIGEIDRRGASGSAIKSPFGVKQKT